MPDVEFLNLVKINEPDRAALVDAAEAVINSGWYLNGDRVTKFEEEFASYVGVQFCVGVGSGLDALSLVLKAWIELGLVEIGDEVVLPANSFVASAFAVVEAGLVPVFVDPDFDSFVITPRVVEDAISPRTKVLMPVSLYGHAVDIVALRSLAEKYGLLILEDAAQAHGAAVNGLRAGSVADAAAFSFYPGKNLGALGNAGAVTTRTRELANMVREIANYGANKRYLHTTLGGNSRLDELQAAFLSIKLKRLDEYNSSRRAIAQRYGQQINNPYVTLPLIADNVYHVFHQFVLRCSQRESLARHLEGNLISTGIHYPTPIPQQPAFRNIPHKDRSNYAPESKTLISIPIDPTMNDEQINQVISAVNEFSP